MKRFSGLAAVLALLILSFAACSTEPPAAPPPEWEAANPVRPLPVPPLGIEGQFSSLPEPPTPERARLGRWLFYDTRLSSDGSISCSTCHRPEHGFSEPTPVSTGINGQKGTRKSPSFLNVAFAYYPHQFWDGRAASLEEQALGPVENPIEMGNTHKAMIETLTRIDGYRPYFKEAFGSEEVTKDRVAKAIADYERTCLSGNSPWDRWRKKRDEAAVSDEVKKGHDLFFGKAGCAQCHVGPNFTDSKVHNLGVGWDPKTRTFADDGRYLVTKLEGDKGAFKTPTLRDVALHAPYLHDGSAATLIAVVELYDDGGHRNPYLDAKVKKLDLEEHERAALVKFMEALTGESPKETAPAAFPK
jgi:cytochrome c peroxidase